MKPLTGGFVRNVNETYVGIALSESRPDELTTELEQLKSASEAAARRVTFDSEPAEFRATLMALAEDRQ